MKKRDIYIWIGVFLLVIGLLPFFRVDYGKLSLVVNALISLSGLIVLINR